MKRTILAFTLILTLLLTAVPACASTNGAHIPGMTDEMYDYTYWIDAADTDTSAILMTKAEIAAMNRLCMDTPQAQVRDFTGLTESYDASPLRASLSSEAIPTAKYYIDGELLDNEKYFGGLEKDIAATAYTGQRKIQYAICTTHADIKSYPTNSMIMDSLTDTADEMQLSSLIVNEPFVIKQKCDREGTTFYWGYADNVSGWVDGANLAICSDKAEWLDAWYIDDIEGRDFLVVTQDHITLEPSTDPSYPAGLRLAMGVTLKLVAEEDVPTTVGERGTLVNYVVYVPTRDADGRYVKKMALIPIHASVSEGYLPYTQEMVLDLAFRSEGNRYGWGNMLENLDCSGYIRNILRCFGFTFPRNTTWQRNIPGTKVDLSGLTNEEKIKVLKTLPLGTPLYMPGHAMVYIGTVDDTPYVISSTAMFTMPEGDINIVKYLSVIPTPMTIRKSNGKNWLDVLETAVVVKTATNISDYDITAVKEPGQTAGEASITVSKDDQVLDKANYNVVLPEAGSRAVMAIGSGDYFGFLKTDIEVNGCVCGFIDVPETAYYAEGVRFCAENGLMSGMGNEKFSPDAPVTEAQVETVIAKINRKNAAESWAAALEKYGKTVITREAAVVKLYGYAKENGLLGEEFEETGAASEKLAAFTDASEIDPENIDAMNWAVDSGLMSGTGNGVLDVKGTLTRGQFATLLQKCYALISK